MDLQVMQIQKGEYRPASAEGGEWYYAECPDDGLVIAWAGWSSYAHRRAWLMIRWGQLRKKLSPCSRSPRAPDVQ